MLEKFILFLLPKWQLNGTPYKSLWNQKEIKDLRNVCKITFYVAAAVYIAHYIFVDRYVTNGADNFWLLYRFFLATLALVGAIVSPRITNVATLNLLLLSYGVLATYLQTYSMTKTALVPYFWSFIIPSVIVSLASIQIPASFIFLGFCFYITWPTLIASGTEVSLLYGTAIASFGILIVYKKSLKDKLSYFLTQQELFRLEKKLVESQKDLTNSILKIFPKKHKEMLLDLVVNKSLTPIQAMDEILQLKEVDIACIFTDIRGYTQASKQIDFVANSIVPNINEITKILETCNGIPSFVGDLIFTYFDDKDLSKNILNSLNAAVEVLELQIHFNKKNPNNIIQRYLILDCGKAMVGNIGGIDSSMEITAMGTPANLSARLDEVTKNSEVKKILGKTAVVLSPNFTSKLKEITEFREIQKIDLKSFDISVRDFPEIKEVYFFNDNDLDLESSAAA